MCIDGGGGMTISQEAKFIAWTTILLSVVVAVSTAVQALVAYEQRQAPYSIALFQKQLELIAAISDAGQKRCQGRLCFEKEGEARASCLVEPQKAAAQFDAAIDQLELFSAPARSGALRNYQLTNMSLLHREKLDDEIEKQSWSSKFLKALEYRDQCNKRLRVFIAHTSRDMGLFSISTDMLGQMRDVRWKVVE